MKHAPGQEKKKALAGALRANLHRRKAQARGRKAGSSDATGDETTKASHAGAPTDTASTPTTEPRDP